MFLLVFVRHVGAHPGEHQHGVSIQISISLSKTFLRISRIRNIPLTRILARVFVHVPPFISQILDFIYWTVLIFILIYFERRDTENQQYCRSILSCSLCSSLEYTDSQWRFSHIFHSIGEINTGKARFMHTVQFDLDSFHQNILSFENSLF